MQVALLVLVVMGVVVGSAKAGIESSYLPIWYTTNGTYGETRPDEHQTGNPTTGWKEYLSGTFNLASGATMWFAMDNRWDPTKHKEAQFNLTVWKNDKWFLLNNSPDETVTEDEYVNTIGYGWGYDLDDVPGASSTPTGVADAIVSRSGTSAQLWYTSINPQPSWEWMSVTNNTLSPVSFSHVDGWSVCTPEPSLGLLLLVGMIPVAIGFRRRRRS